MNHREHPRPQARGTQARSSTQPPDPNPVGVTSGEQVADQPRPVTTAVSPDELQALARYARQRYDLYKAKAYGPRLTSPTRLRELERECLRAEARLRFAKAEVRHNATDPPGPSSL
jgi:hypothetical protein